MSSDLATGTAGQCLLEEPDRLAASTVVVAIAIVGVPSTSSAGCTFGAEEEVLVAVEAWWSREDEFVVALEDAAKQVVGVMEA